MLMGKISLYNALKKTKRLSARRITFIISSDGEIKEVLENINPAEKHVDKALGLLKEISQSI